MITELTGFSGMFLILFAFIMNQINKWKGDFIIYDAFNSIGSFSLIVYAIMISSYPFLILNIVWFVVSIRDVLLDLKKTKKKIIGKDRFLFSKKKV
jgi:hypothetical protein